MSDTPEDVDTVEALDPAALADLAELPLEERAPGFGALLAALETRLESADAAD